MQICHALCITERVQCRDWMKAPTLSNGASTHCTGTWGDATQKQRLCNNPIKKKLKLFYCLSSWSAKVIISTHSFQTQIEMQPFTFPGNFDKSL